MCSRNWGFLYKDVVLTKNGEFLYCAKVTPRSTDAVGAEELDSVCAAWQRMMGGIEPPHRLYVICERRPVEGETRASAADGDLGELVQYKRESFIRRTLFEFDVWVVFCYDPGLSRRVGRDHARWFLENLRRWLGHFQSAPPITRYLRDVVERGEREARSVWDTVRALVHDETAVDPIEGARYAQLLHRLVNFRSTGWVRGESVPHYGLSIDLADSVLAFERTHAMVDHRLIGTYSLALPPRRLTANALAPLYSKPWEFNSILEWRPLYREQAAGKVKAVQKHYNNLRWSFFSAMNETEGTDMAVEDAGAAATVSNLETAAIELGSEGVPYGELALSFAVAANTREELDSRGAELNRCFVEFDAKIVRERYGQAPVWFQRMVGAARKALPRPVMVSSGLASCLVPAFGGPHRPSGVQSSEEARARAVPDPMEYGVRLRPVRRGGCRPHLGSRSHRFREVVRSQLPSAAEPAVQAPHRDPRSGRVVPLDHEARWRFVPFDAYRFDRRGRRQYRERVAPVPVAAGESARTHS